MMTPIAAPPPSTSQGLSRPVLAASTEGKPKTPLPMMELTISATRLQRPMARTSLASRVEGIGEFCITSEDKQGLKALTGKQAHAALKGRSSTAWLALAENL